MMTDSESTQMTGMINWAENTKSFQSIQLMMFKQYRKNEKKYVTMYEVYSREFINNKWRIKRGTGESVLVAMNNFTKAWAAKEDL